MAMPPACSVRWRIEKATYETLPFRFIAGGLHPDHDTLANFRKTFLPVIKELFVQMLLLAQAAGYFELGNIRMDGSKVHANASKSKAISYKRLVELEVQLRAEVDVLFRLAEQADQPVPPGMVIADAIAIRQERLTLPGGGQNSPGSPRPGTLRHRKGRGHDVTKCAPVLQKPHLRAANPVGVRRHRPRRPRRTPTSTTSPIPSRGS